MTGIFQQLAAGQITVLTTLLWLVIAFAFAVLGGAIAGMKLAGKDLGNELAAMMGAMFGPTGAVPGILLGLIVIALF